MEFVMFEWTHGRQARRLQRGMRAGLPFSELRRGAAGRVPSGRGYPGAPGVTTGTWARPRNNDH